MSQSKLLSFKEWVPENFRFYLYLFFLAGFQFSNGIYFAAMSQMSSDLALSNNDVMMMARAGLVGLTVYFPLAFRFKARFTSQTNLLLSATILLICNILVPSIQSVPVLIILCFIAGFFRLCGTFECLSNVLPIITPTYKYPVFLSFVFFVVIGMMQVLDVAVSQIVFYFDWQFVHYMVVAIMIGIILCAIILMRPFRFMPKLPFYAVDWLGLILWSLFLLALLFIVQYGEQMDWLSSKYIRVAAAVATLSLAFNMIRMENLRHPYLEKQAFTAKNLWYLMLLFFLMDILLSTQNVLQNIFTASILRLDYLNSSYLKLFDFLGCTLGAIISYFGLLHLNWTPKRLMFIGMSCIVFYILIMYFLISPNTATTYLFIPILISGLGHIIIFISLTVYAQATVPFKNYFQVLCILGFVRTGIASPLGNAIYSIAMKGFMQDNIAQMGSEFGMTVHNASPTVFNAITDQALMSSVQQLYGYSFILGIAVLIAILSSHFKKPMAKLLLLQHYRVK